MISEAPFGGGYAPFLYRVSALLTAVASIFINISSLPGFGNGQFPKTRTSGPPALEQTIVFIVVKFLLEYQ